MANYSSKEIEMEWPHCLNIDSRGYFMIGSNTAKKKYVTNLYIVQFSGFWKIQTETENNKEVVGQQYNQP
jgi:hypothetical protein